MTITTSNIRGIVGIYATEVSINGTNFPIFLKHPFFGDTPFYPFETSDELSFSVHYFVIEWIDSRVHMLV
jgi:hypothetical protein